MSEIIEFWENHFECSNVSNVIPQKKLLSFLLQSMGVKLTRYQFFNITTGNIGVQTRKGKNCKFFLAKPISEIAIKYLGYDKPMEIATTNGEERSQERPPSSIDEFNNSIMYVEPRTQLTEGKQLETNEGKQAETPWTGRNPMD